MQYIHRIFRNKPCPSFVSVTFEQTPVPAHLTELKGAACRFKDLSMQIRLQGWCIVNRLRV